jgi:hypothetical protein
MIIKSLWINGMTKGGNTYHIIQQCVVGYMAAVKLKHYFGLINQFRWCSCASKSNVNKGLISPVTCSWINLCSWLYFWIRNCSKISIRHPLEAQCISVALLCMVLNLASAMTESFSGITVSCFCPAMPVTEL